MQRILCSFALIGLFFRFPVLSCDGPGPDPGENDTDTEAASDDGTDTGGEFETGSEIGTSPEDTSDTAAPDSETPIDTGIPEDTSVDTSHPTDTGEVDTGSLVDTATETDEDTAFETDILPDTETTIPDTETTQQGDTITLIGRVRSFADGAPITGAAVVTLAEETSTDADGNFSLTVPRIFADDYLRVTVEGFAPYQQSLSIYSPPTATTSIRLLPVDTEAVIDPGLETGNTITTPDGASVHFPPLDGITENLVVAITSYNVNTHEITCVPGDFSALDSNGEDVHIVSQGMMDVTIVGETSAETYSLEGMGEYTITMPITGDAAPAPDTIPSWYFDTDISKWIEFGTLTKTANGRFYTGTVTHFTTWNADFKLESLICIQGQVDNDGGDYEIVVTGQGFTKRFTDNEPTFEVINLPPGQEMSVTITASDPVQVSSESFSTNSSPNCLDLGLFTFNEVIGLQINVLDADGDGKENDVRIIWESDPMIDGFVRAEIVYRPLGDEDNWSDPISVEPGVRQVLISDLADWIYEFEVKSVFMENGGLNYSNGLNDIKSIEDYYILTVVIEEAISEFYADLEVFVERSDLMMETLYTEPVFSKSDTVFNLRYSPPDYPLTWMWPGGSSGQDQVQVSFLDSGDTVDDLTVNLGYVAPSCGTVDDCEEEVWPSWEVGCGPDDGEWRCVLDLSSGVFGLVCQATCACVDYLDCETMSPPVVVDCGGAGYWDCIDSLCVESCHDDCVDVDDCFSREWEEACQGHWACNRQLCEPVCDDPDIVCGDATCDAVGGETEYTCPEDCMRCAVPEDCVSLSNWTLPCDGVWLCEDERCTEFCAYGDGACDDGYCDRENGEGQASCVYDCFESCEQPSDCIEQEWNPEGNCPYGGYWNCDFNNQCYEVCPTIPIGCGNDICDAVETADSCQPDCLGGRCEQVLDCVGHPWDVSCDGHWECLPGRNACDAVCDNDNTCPDDTCDPLNGETPESCPADCTDFTCELSGDCDNLPIPDGCTEWMCLKRVCIPICD